LWPRPREGARWIGGTLWLDGFTESLAAAALGAAVLVEVVLESTQGSLSTVATNLAYPLGDVLLLSAVFGGEAVQQGLAKSYDSLQRALDMATKRGLFD